MRISDWSSDVCSSDLVAAVVLAIAEIVAPGIFLIWLAAAAGLTGFLVWLFGAVQPSIGVQLVVFAVLAFGSIYLGRMLMRRNPRSEEHTSELQSLMRISYAVFCLKKKKNTT